MTWLLIALLTTEAGDTWTIRMHQTAQACDADQDSQKAAAEKLRGVWKLRSRCEPVQAKGEV